MSTGLLITVEGIHGSGKTTCISYLRERLQEAGRTAVVTNNQSGTILGRELRELHLVLFSATLDRWTEALLIAAASRQTFVEIIEPALVRGDTVISERFCDAFIAFQGYGRHLDIGFLQALRERIDCQTKPDITLLLDLPAEVALTRLPSESMHRIEREPTAFHEAVRNGYLAVAMENPDRVVVIDATRPLPEILTTAWEQISSRLP